MPAPLRPWISAPHGHVVRVSFNRRVQLHEWQAHTIPILYPNSHFEVSQGGFRDFSRMADRQCDDAEVPGMSQVPLGDLARLLEANSGVRTRVMDARKKMVN